MKYTKLGNSELNVSRICMGCMGFGDAANGQHSWTLDEEHSREIIRHGLELGVNFFDTAAFFMPASYSASPMLPSHSDTLLSALSTAESLT